MRPFKPDGVSRIERGGAGSPPAPPAATGAPRPRCTHAGGDPSLLTGAGPLRLLRGAIAPAALVGLYIALLAPLLPIASESFALAGVFSTDEELSGRIVERMVLGPTLDPSHFFSYGALYHELSALLAWPLVALGGGERVVLLALRATALAGGAATLALTYVLGQRLYGRAAGLVAAALLALSSELAGWSVTAHPDTLQLALNTAALVAICVVRGQASAGRVALAAALAGLAFATKYGGVLLVPLLLLAAAAAHIEAGRRGPALLRRIAADGALSVVVFAGLFVVTNPYALVEWRRFITQVRFELWHTRTGHVLQSDQSPVHWLRLVAGPRLAGPVVAAAAALGAGAALVAAWRGSEARDGDRLGRLAALVTPRTIVLLWTAGSLAILLAVAGYHAPRYALPLLPGVAVLGAGWTTETFARRRAGWVAVAALVGATALFAAAPLVDVYRTRAERASDLDHNPRILAGHWLEANLSPGAAVIADAYVYLPDRFTERTITFGLTGTDVDARRPVAIVVNDDIRGRFTRPEDADRYIDGVEAYRERAAAYAGLESGTLGCYALVQGFGGVRIYADREAWTGGATNGCGISGTEWPR